MAISDIDSDFSYNAGNVGDEFEQEQENDAPGGTMTLIEHLAELRKRLFISLLAVVVTTIAAFSFHDAVIRFLEIPLNGVYKGLIATGVGEGFTVVLKVALGVGIALATPVWLYQVWAFIAPALTRKERKYALPFTLIGVALFIVGLSVGFLTLKFPVSFLLQFGRDSGFHELISADNYFSFILFFMLAFGITFELPLVLTFTSLVGLVSSRMLAKNRSYVLVGLWMLACVVTPGADPYSPIILGVSLTLLYFLSELLIRAIGK